MSAPSSDLPPQDGPVDATPESSEPDPAPLPQPSERRWRQIAWLGGRWWQWLLAHTFVPGRVPARSRHPATGYVLAVLLQVVGVATTQLLTMVFPTYSFPSLLSIVAVALTAVSWGAGPSLLAALVGLVLLETVVVPIHMGEGPETIGDLLEVALFLAAGLSISLVSSRIEGNRQRSEAERAQAHDHLEALQALTDTALSHLGLENLLRELLDRIVAVIGVDSAAILLLDDDGQHLTVRAARGLEEAVAAKVQVPVGKGFAGRIAATRQPLVVEDLASYPVVNPLLHERVRSALGVPLLVGDRLVGVVHVDSAIPRHFTEQEVQLVQLVGDRLALAIDRAELFKAEQTARRAAEWESVQLDRTFDAMADGVMVYDPDGRVVRTNAAVRRILGMDLIPPEVYDRPVRERVPLFITRDSRGTLLAPEDWPMMRVLRGEALTGPDTMDIQVRLPDGREVDLNVSGAPLYDPTGRLIGAVGVYRDQTERRRLEREREEALRSREAWFHTMADTAPVLLWVADTDGLVTFVNAPWLHFTGRSLEQELGNGWAEGVHPDDYERCLETYLAAFRAREGFTTEYRLRRFDGEYRWTVDTGVPRFAQDGAFLGYIGSAIDITENKRLEREHADAQANELASREVNRHMDEFLATAAHDLRQPVTGAAMGIGLAQRRLQRLAATADAPLPAAGERSASALDEAIHTVERAGQAVERMSRLVARLFDVAQAQSGTLELKPVACNLAALVREQVELQHMMMADRTVCLDLPTKRPVPVVADADRLGQVLTNYLTNALKYSPPDRPIVVSLEVHSRLARVAVRDEGPGLPPDERNRSTARQASRCRAQVGRVWDWACTSARSSSRPMAARWVSRARPGTVRPSGSPSRWRRPGPEMTRAPLHCPDNALACCHMCLTRGPQFRTQHRRRLAVVRDLSLRLLAHGYARFPHRDLHTTHVGRAPQPGWMPATSHARPPVAAARGRPR